MSLFTKKNRLRSKEDFKSVSLGGKRYDCSLFVIYCRRGRSSAPRLGISASKKCGIAVKRNYFKRRMREMFRTHIERFPLDSEVHIKLNTPLKSSDESLYQKIQNKLLEILPRETTQ
jgi:ribonuclease P protein component